MEKTKKSSKSGAKQSPAKKSPAKKSPPVKNKTLPAVKVQKKALPVPEKKPLKDAKAKTPVAVKKKPAVTVPKKASSYSVELTVPDFKGKKKKFYELLMKIRDQILGQMKFLSEEALEGNSAELAGSVSNHMADFGSDNFLHDMELNMISDEGEVIEMIDEAIARLQTKEFGKCLECGCTISEQRLLAKPYAKYCVDCKTMRENSGDVSPG